MRDYFREFLIPTKSRLGAVSASPAPPTIVEKAKTPMKTHFMWGAGLVGASLLTWQVSKWHTHYTSSISK